MASAAGSMAAKCAPIGKFVSRAIPGLNMLAQGWDIGAGLYQGDYWRAGRGAAALALNLVPYAGPFLSTAVSLAPLATDYMKTPMEREAARKANQEYKQTQYANAVVQTPHTTDPRAYQPIGSKLLSNNPNEQRQAYRYGPPPANVQQNSYNPAKQNGSVLQAPVSWYGQMNQRNGWTQPMPNRPAPDAGYRPSAPAGTPPNNQNAGY